MESSWQCEYFVRSGYIDSKLGGAGLFLISSLKIKASERMDAKEIGIDKVADFDSLSKSFDGGRLPTGVGGNGG